MKSISFVTGILLIYFLTSISNKKMSIDIAELRWTIQPMEVAKQVFSQCSRQAPKPSKILRLDDNIYLNALITLTEKSDILKTTANIEINEFTYQLVAYREKKKNYIYFNANYTNIRDEEKMNWQEKPIIWCDGGHTSWGIVYAVETNKLLNFVTNGPAVYKLDEL